MHVFICINSSCAARQPVSFSLALLKALRLPIVVRDGYLGRVARIHRIDVTQRRITYQAAAVQLHEGSNKHSTENEVCGCSGWRTRSILLNNWELIDNNQRDRITIGDLRK